MKLAAWVMGLALCAASPLCAQTLVPVDFAEASDMWGQARVQIDSSVQCVTAREAGCAAAGQLVDELQALPIDARVEAVNRWVNAKPYVSDQENWGRDDYWERIDEFLSFGGDCEDYAVAKYALLRALGIAAEAMQVMVAIDQRNGEVHAVLAVHDGDGIILLDNQTDQLIPAEMDGHLQMRVAVNETSLWRTPAQPMVKQSASPR